MLIYSPFLQKEIFYYNLEGILTFLKNERGIPMPKDNAKPALKDFEVETVFEDRVHQRHAFAFKYHGNEFKGFFHENEIQWLHPQPKQMLDENEFKILENIILTLLKQYGILSNIEDFELTQAFEDKLHERLQFTVQVQGDEYKGFLHHGEIQWFHPQPAQKLDDNHVEEIESDIHEIIANQEGSTKKPN